MALAKEKTRAEGVVDGSTNVATEVAARLAAADGGESATTATDGCGCTSAGNSAVSLDGFIISPRVALLAAEPPVQTRAITAKTTREPAAPEANRIVLGRRRT